MKLKQQLYYMHIKNHIDLCLYIMYNKNILITRHYNLIVKDITENLISLSQEINNLGLCTFLHYNKTSQTSLFVVYKMN